VEQLSVNMFWLAIVATATATVLYWGYAFGVRLAVRLLATNGPVLVRTGVRCGVVSQLE
jgi:hypothetical protein